SASAVGIRHRSSVFGIGRRYSASVVGIRHRSSVFGIGGSVIGGIRQLKRLAPRRLFQRT
ncbi:MAG TPA: hypothetical protein VIX73_38350, partial [Kofleriaceae bacterium]